jgi:hypothetical protein
MAIVVITEPDDIGQQEYDGVISRLGLADDPPEGMIVHTAGDDGGTWRIVDVWESQEAHDRFRDERLLPAIEATMRERGGEPPSGPPSGSTYELHNLQVAPGAGTS